LCPFVSEVATRSIDKAARSAPAPIAITEARNSGLGVQRNAINTPIGRDIALRYLYEKSLKTSDLSYFKNI